MKSPRRKHPARAPSRGVTGGAAGAGTQQRPGEARSPAEPNRAKLSRAEPSLSEPSRAHPSRQRAEAAAAAGMAAAFGRSRAAPRRPLAAVPPPAAPARPFSPASGPGHRCHSGGRGSLGRVPGAVCGSPALPQHHCSVLVSGGWRLSAA